MSEAGDKMKAAIDALNASNAESLAASRQMAETLDAAIHAAAPLPRIPWALPQPSNESEAGQ